jgi:uncharacterized phage infection (PIP) family protein YhgE
MYQSPPPTPEALLKSGLTALKQGTPHQAVALLSQLQNQPKASNSQKLKARVGLVRAYRALGQVAEARSLCERLQQVSQPQVQQWAERTLSELATAESPSPTDKTGFRPLAPEVAPGEAQRDANRDASGFVPFTQSDPTPSSPTSDPVSPDAATPTAPPHP